MAPHRPRDQAISQRTRPGSRCRGDGASPLRGAADSLRWALTVLPEVSVTTMSFKPALCTDTGADAREARTGWH